jgi:hypothetical protein
VANAKTNAIAVGVALLLAGAAYGVGRYQGVAKVNEADARATAAASASANAVSSTRMALEIERGKVARLEGRRRLHLAMLALEERNFGIAQEQLAATRKELASAAGGDNELTKITSELDAFKVVATDDVGEQRKKMLDWCKRIDATLAPI